MACLKMYFIKITASIFKLVFIEWPHLGMVQLASMEEDFSKWPPLLPPGITLDFSGNL